MYGDTNIYINNESYCYICIDFMEKCVYNCCDRVSNY